MFSIIDEGIRHRLVQARVAAGVTQGYVARRRGISEATYGRYERGEQPLSASRLGRVAGVRASPCSTCWATSRPSGRTSTGW